MPLLNRAYIDGEFVSVSGSEVIDVTNPANEEVIGRVQLANRDDAKRAVAAANRAQPTLARATKSQRIEMLKSLEAAVRSRTHDIEQSTIEEYGGPQARVRFVSQYASQCFGHAAQTLENYDFERQIGDATVFMNPVGVSALIAPWNSTAGTICSKLAYALAAGCASVIKPSELSPFQTQIVAEALHAGGLPAGVFNILLGRGGDVGDELSTSPDIRKISFTGSTATGKIIARAGVETMKRVSLALSGKSASIILDDADFAAAVPLALNGGFSNNGQACVAGTRILVPRSRLDEVIRLVGAFASSLRVGDPGDPATTIGPVASRAQFDHVQGFIRRGLEQGATLVVGGEGRPEGLDKGYFVKPTVFANVRDDMDIAREEIFGPVLSIITYETEEQAIEIANDSAYGLQAYVFSTQGERATRVAAQLEAGTVLINTTRPDLLAPFGGVKQSGIGREFGVFGLESFLEAKTVATA